MTEPVLPFDLKLGNSAGGTLTKALYRALRAAVLARTLPSGYSLPSTRRLAEALSIGRNTVITAYDQLVATGFARSRPGARLVVTHSHPENNRSRSDAVRRTALPVAERNPKNRIAPIWRRPVHQLVYGAILPARSFRTGVPEHRFFNHDVWRRLTSRASRSIARLPFTYGSAQGLAELREAIAGHVAFVRAVVCKPSDLIITSGAQQAFDLVARLLVTPGRTRVAVEDPAYPPLRAALIAAGARLVPVPLDAEGLRVDRIPRDVGAICVTPSHQSPTGAVMSAARRTALLDLARAQNAVIIEDDYDGEFLYDAHAQDALQTLDRDNRVFYIGTFSKCLFPGLRKGFVVAPDWAVDKLIDIKRGSDSHTDVIPQATLAAFISEGHLARHIRRMRPIYALRRHTLEQAALEHWTGFMDVLPGNAGLHLSTRFIDTTMTQAILDRASVHLPGALPLSAYSMGTPRPNGLCIGYGSVEVDQISSAVRALGLDMAGARRGKGSTAGAIPRLA